VLLVGHHRRAEAAALAQATTTWLHERGHHAWMADADAEALGLGGLAADDDPTSAELLVSLGGDGTMLRAVQLLDGAAVPIIGVNVGLLGYLAEVEPEGLVPALERFFAGPERDRGDWEIEERMMLDAVVDVSGGGSHTIPVADSGADSADGTQPRSWRALNEGVLEREEPGHTVRLLVRIDGAPFTSYSADGLIVATPTGSTAYSMSARGPVVSPRHRALLLTPVSPHTLFDRALVLDPDELIEMEVIGHRPVVLSIDGQRARQLHEGDVVRFSSSACTARFVRFGRRRFHQILKAKFGLADR
jgi:NAD+ kinase